MHHYLKPSWKTGLMLVLAVACLAAIHGCLFSPDDEKECDNPPCDDPPDLEPSRATPSDLLTKFFDHAYETRDSTLYAEMLDEEFSFYFLQVDADSLRDVLGSDNFWGRTLDLESTGGMFRAPEVTGITLNISVESNQASTNEECLECRVLETSVTLLVSTIQPGPDPELTFTVASDQTFYTRRDPADTTLWVLWRQIDRPSGGSKGLAKSLDLKL